MSLWRPAPWCINSAVRFGHVTSTPSNSVCTSEPSSLGISSHHLCRMYDSNKVPVGEHLLPHVWIQRLTGFQSILSHILRNIWDRIPLFQHWFEEDFLRNFLLTDKICCQTLGLGRLDVHLKIRLIHSHQSRL